MKVEALEERGGEKKLWCIHDENIFEEKPRNNKNIFKMNDIYFVKPTLGKW